MSGALNDLVVKISADTAALKSGMRDAQRATDDAARRMAGSFKGVSAELKNWAGGVVAGVGVAAALNSFIDAAKQAERASIGLATTARYAGAGMMEAQLAAESLTKDGLLSVAEASQGLQNLLSRGFNLKESIELMNRFKDSASFNRQASLEFGQAVVTATEGLKNENSILVDNAGVTKNVSMMWKEYAAQQGTSVDKLTQAQKRTAEYNGILRETEGQLGNAARMTETFAGQQAKLNQALFDFKATAGREIMPVLADIARGLQPIISLIKDLVEGFEKATVSWAAWMDKIGAYYKVGGVAGMVFKSNRDEFRKQLGIINQAAYDTKMDISKRFEHGAGIPNIGMDSGKRRTDIVLPASIGGRRSGSSSHSSASKAADEAKKKEQELRDAMLKTWKSFADAGRASSDRFQAQAKELSDLNVQVLELTGQYVKAAEAKEAFERSTPEFRELVAGAKFGDANAALRLRNRNTIFDLDRQAAFDREAQAAGEYGSFRTSMSTSGLTGIEAQRAQIEQSYQTRLAQAQKFYDSYHQDLEKFNQDCVAASKERDQMISDAERAELENRLGAVSNMFGELGATLMEGNKEQFEIGKALCIASAIINTYSAAAAAFAGITAATSGWGTALAAAQMAMVIATGMAQVAAIESTEYSPRASGGIVNAGMAYLVGEQGPELMVAGQDGRIIPNHALGGGQKIEVTNVYQISTGVSETVRAELYRHMPVIAQHSVNAVQTAINSGTSLSKAVRRM